VKRAIVGIIYTIHTGDYYKHVHTFAINIFFTLLLIADAGGFFKNSLSLARFEVYLTRFLMVVVVAAVMR
jgi:hypothetical protein